MTALVSCVLGHSKMGARLWSQRRSTRAARPPPSPQHHSQTILAPTTFTHSVLYVCESMSMSGSVGEAMAAARDRATRYESVQQDAALGFPYQVSRPEAARLCPLRSITPLATSESQEAEITREYIKPPPNKTLSDMEGEGPHRSYSTGVLHGDWGVAQGGHHHHHHHQSHHRHSASLDRPSLSADFSSSPSSSAGCGSGDESNRGSQKTSVRSGQRHFLSYVTAFTSPKNERAPQSSQEGSRQGSRHQGGPPHDSVPLHYPTAASSLAGITTVPLPCGPTHSPGYSSGSGVSQGTHVGSSLGAQGGLPHTYEQSSQSGCSTSTDHDLPPLYDHVIENPNLYTSVSRPSEQRTNSGKI